MERKKRHCYQGPGRTNREVYFGGGLAQIGWATFRGKIVSGQDPREGGLYLASCPCNDSGIL